MEKIIAKVAAIGTEQLKEMLVALFHNHEEGSMIVFKVVMDELERRMPESEFVSFCEGIE